MVSRYTCSSQRNAPQVEHVTCSTFGLAQNRRRILERGRQRSSIRTACKSRAAGQPTAQLQLMNKKHPDALLQESAR